MAYFFYCRLQNLVKGQLTGHPVYFKDLFLFLHLIPSAISSGDGGFVCKLLYFFSSFFYSSMQLNLAWCSSVPVSEGKLNIERIIDEFFFTSHFSWFFCYFLFVFA